MVPKSRKKSLAKSTMSLLSTASSFVSKAANIVEASGDVALSNGDVYQGFYELKKKEKIIKAQGPGTYITAQGDKYEGVWEKDILIADVKISYNDQSSYVGEITESEYDGNGWYTYPDGTRIGPRFARNAPDITGGIQLIDPSGHMWTGIQQDMSVSFEPTNHFYEWACTLKDDN